MKKSILIALFTISAFTFPVHAEEKTLVLDIEDSVKLAVENNISVLQGKIALDQAKRHKDHSWNSASPSLSVSAGASKSNKDFNDNYTAHIQGKVSISLSGNLYTDIRNAALSYEQGQLTYENTVRTVEMNVRNAFYNLLYQKDFTALKKSALETSRRQYEQNLAKYRQGAISQIDVLSSQVDYEKKKPAVEAAQISYDNALANFKQSLGIEQERQIELKGSLDEITSISEISITGIESKAPALMELEKKLEIAKNKVTANRFSAYGPVISAGWTYQPSISKSAKADKPTDPSDTGSLSLSVTLPLDGLLPWSVRADNIQNAKDEVKNLELQIQDKKTSIAVSTEGSLRKINQSISTLKSLKASISLARQSFQMTQEAYNRGSRDLLTLRAAADSLQEAELNLKSEAYNLMSEILSLENMTGIPFGTIIK